MRKTLLFLTVFYTVILFGQERYKIIYNFKEDKIEYQQLVNDKILKEIWKIKKQGTKGNSENKEKLNSYKFNTDSTYIILQDWPRYRKQDIVQVVMDDFNPFAVSIKDDIEKENYLNTNNSTALGLVNNIGILSDGRSGFKVNTELEGMFSKARSNGDKMINKFYKLIDDYRAIKLKEDELKRVIALNPKIDPQQRIFEALKVLIENNEINVAIDNNDTLNSENIYKYWSKLKVNYELNIESLQKDIANKIKSDSIKLVQSSRSKAEILEISDQDFEQLKTEFGETFQSLEQLYTTVMSASTNANLKEFEIDSDKINFIIDVFKNPSPVPARKAQLLPTAQPADKAITHKVIPIESYGGIKVNTSVAFTFNNFGNNSKSFFIEDGVVREDENNEFVPNLSTLINVYYFLSKNFNPGVSFGLSIPVSQELSGVNYLIGPSLTIGNKNRISLSGGLAFGPVDELTNGLSAGSDTSVTDIDNITKTVYKPGWYFGISFSFLGLN